MEGTIAIKDNLPTTTGVESGVRIGVEACQGRSNLLPEYLAAGRQGPRGLIGPCADAALHGRHGRVQPHRVTQPVGPFQTESVQPDSSGSAVQGANVWNDRDVGFVSDGNASVNDGSENPGVLHPTKQGRPALRIRTLVLRAPAVPDSATVWGLRAETGSGRVRFVHQLGLRFLEHVRTGQSATAVAQPASRARSPQTRSPESPCLKCLGFICLTATATRRHVVGCRGLGQLPGCRHGRRPCFGPAVGLWRPTPAQALPAGLPGAPDRHAPGDRDLSGKANNCSAWAAAKAATGMAGIVT